MTNILMITSSAQGEASVSTRMASVFADQLRAAYPGANIVTRDIGANPIPHLTEHTIAGIRGDAVTEAELAARALSDELIGELRAADLIVIASPMYNFGISSTLKAWFDHVLRARVTFRYTEAGPEGLLGGRKVVVIESRAGFYSAGESAGADSQEPHLRTMLGFMGLTDVSFVRVEKLAFGDEAATAAIAGATAELKALAGAEMSLAA